MVIELESGLVETPPDILLDLRRSTRDLIEQYDACVDLAGMTGSMIRYIRFLQTMYGFYKPVEKRLDEALSPFEKAGFDYDARRKTTALFLDLISAGISRSSIKDLELCRDVPEIESRAQALGVLFVLEELIVGGEFVSQLLTQRIGLSSDRGSRFFRGYRENSLLMTREFSRILASNLDQEGEGEATAAARETFKILLTWQASNEPAIQRCG